MEGNHPAPGEAARSDAAIRQHYDAVPFPAAPRPLTHPDRLAAMGIVFGMTPQPLDRCRVLEVGCADGGNLMPMAETYPSSRFVGIDLSPRQIESGRQTAGQLGLANLTLTAASIVDFGDGADPFDYIVAHGVFSWVPRWVQDGFLAALRRLLAPSGIAYVSYNTYPGWHSNQMLREMMLHHVRHIEEPFARAEKAFELVHFLAASADRADAAFTVFIKNFQSMLETKPEFVHYFIHEFLEENNTPVYFREFVERAEAAGLQYIADADPAEAGAGALPEATAAQLRAWATSPQDLEQYVDFVRNNRFRRSLLCRREVTLDRTPQADRMRSLHVSTPALPSEPPEGETPDERHAWFHTPRQRHFSTDHDLTIAALRTIIGYWPSSIPFGDLVVACGKALSASPDDTGRIERELTAVVMDLFGCEALELHAAPIPCVRTPGEKPAVTPLCRLQAARREAVTNRRHRPVRIDDDAAHFILLLLDGSRDRVALAAEMARALREGRLRIEYQGRPLSEHPQADAILLQLVAHRLRGFADHALLVR